MTSDAERPSLAVGFQVLFQVLAHHGGQQLRGRRDTCGSSSRPSRQASNAIASRADASTSASRAASSS
jgi:hypothetical protein